MIEYFFKVADAYFSVQFTEPDIDNRDLIPTCAPFHVAKPDAEPMFTVVVSSNLVNAEPEGEEMGQFDCGGMTHGVFKTADGYKFQLRNIDGQMACAMKSHNRFSRCEVSLFGDENNRAYGLNNALMLAFAYAGAHHQIVLMHASVTVFKERGYLFLGYSGTGKSTHSSLWIRHIPGCELLNDDNPAVRVVGNKVYVYGTPWSGKTPCYRNLSFEAGAFVRLKQYPENIIERDNVVKSFASILSSCSTMIWDKPSYDAICDNVTAIVSHVPAYFLRCLPDKAAALLCNKTIAQ
ncbi:MAG: hypothetical protein J6I32_05030 [Bacteroidaceae bacterium]|nr:hypothetical protein [Bacteroidaceae bacterium]